MLKRRFAVFALGIMTAIALFGTAPASGVASAANGPEKVTPIDVQKAAAWQAITETRTEPNSHWQGKRLQVKRPIPVYDPAGNHVAYVVDVLADGQPAGFVLVSAFEDDDPILAWSDGGRGFDPERVKPRLGKDVEKIQSQEVVWLGNGQFGARFTLTDGTAWNVSEDGVVGPSDGTGSYPIPQTRNDGLRWKWGQIKKLTMGSIYDDNPPEGVSVNDPANWELGASSVQRNYITGMDPYNQQQFDVNPTLPGIDWSGCSPTASSNLMGYWAGQGYPDLNPSGLQDVTLALRASMGTIQGEQVNGESQASTDPLTIGFGMTTYVNNQGYTNFGGTSLIFPSWYAITNHIDSGHPGVVSMSGQPYFGSHTVVLAGYKGFIYDSAPPSYYLVVRNNWGDGTFNEYLKWNTWSSVSFDSVYPN